MRRKIALLVWTCLCTSVGAGEPVLLEAVAEAGKSDLDLCAAALGKRLAAFGLKGLKARVVEQDGARRIEVRASGDIAADVVSRIDKLAAYAGRKGSLRSGRDLTAEEKAQGYSRENLGDDLSKYKAPPGTFWAWGLSDTMVRRTDWLVLLRESPSWSWSDVTIVLRGDKEWSFKVSPSVTKAMVAWALEMKEATKGLIPWIPLVAAFDDVTSQPFKVTLSAEKDQLKEGTFQMPASLAESLDPILRFPMPVALKRVSK